jgi:hypothetical protein
MINRYVALFGGLGVLFAAYSVWWHGEAKRLAVSFPQALEKSLPPGARLEHKPGEVDGFPFRLNVQITDVRMSWGDGDWVATPSLTGIFQPFTGDHLILHLDAPIGFSIQGATGSVNAERALASLVGYEGGHYQLDGDAVNVTLDQPGVARITAARAQGHARREEVGNPGKFAFAVSVRNLKPKEAAAGRLAEIIARYGEPQQDGTVNINIDEEDQVVHAGGKTLTPEDGEKLKQEF